jgi:hypothetical protein
MKHLHEKRGQESLVSMLYTEKKKKKNFLIYKEIQMGSGAKSYMRNGFLIYEDLHKFITIYEEAISRI